MTERYFDLRHFTLRDMVELGSPLRKLADSARTMEEVARLVVRYLYEHLVDGESQERSCALVRFFRTHRYDALAPPIRDFAQSLLPADVPPEGLRCLTLLASAGDEPEWNAPEDSVGHRAIPLVSRELVNKAPMISRLLQQLGVEIDLLVTPNDARLLVERSASTFNVFYVPDAPGSPYIPDQDQFVVRFGIQSVLGVGGMLPLGDIFCVILFSKTPISRETAELFRTLALNIKVAALPFENTVFDGEKASDG